MGGAARAGRRRAQTVGGEALTVYNLDDPVPGAVSAEDTAEEAVANLANGPTHFVREQLRTGAPLLDSLPRNDAVRMMIEMGDSAMGMDQG